MADSELELQIRLLADTHGADEVKAALASVTGSQGEITDELKRSIPIMDDAAEGSKKLEINHRALHSILHLIGRESGPAFGGAVAGATALATGGMFAAVIAVQELFKWIEELRKKAEEFREQQASMWIAIQTGIKDATETEKKFQDELEKTKSKENDLKQEFAEANSILDARIKQHKEILDAIEKEQLAEAAGDKEKEAAIKARFQTLKDEFDLTASRVKLEEQEIELFKLSLENRKLSANSDDIKKQLEDAQKQNAIRQEALKNAGDEKKLMGEAGVSGGTSYQDLLKLKQSLETQLKNVDPLGEGGIGLEERINAVQSLIVFEAIKNAAAVNAQKITDLTKQLDGAQAARDANTTALNEETQKIKIGIQTIAIEGQTESDRKIIAAGGKVSLPGLTEKPYLPSTSSGNVPYEKTPEGMARKDFDTEQRLADIIASGGKLDAAQQATLQSIANAMIGHHATAKETKDLIDKLTSTLVTNQNEINDKYKNLVVALESKGQ